MRADDADAPNISANHCKRGTANMRGMPLRKGSPGYATHMMGIYVAVAATDRPNFMAAWLSLPQTFRSIDLRSW